MDILEVYWDGENLIPAEGTSWNGETVLSVQDMYWENSDRFGLIMVK